MHIKPVYPRISVIVPNLNGQRHLEQCLPTVFNQNYPEARIECIVVDNGSIDGSVYFVKKRYPLVKVLALSKNTGFAAAINAGARVASADILVFLNNDARLQSDCLVYLSNPISGGETVCTGAKVMSTDERRVQYARGGMNFHGIAFQYGEGEQDNAEFNAPGPTLFACGGAMAISKEVFCEVGGMDESFFAYFEDVDLGWRLWLMGHDVQYVPEAVALHDQAATSQFIALEKIRVLHIRNPLMMIYKNYGEEYLSRILPVAWMLTIRRGLYLSEIEPGPYRIGEEPQLADPQPVNQYENDRDVPRTTVEIPAIAASDMVALMDWLDGFEPLQEKRKRIQGRRVRTDSELADLFIEPFRYSEDKTSYRTLQDALCEAFGVDALFDIARESS